MRIFIVDDEKPARSELKFLINKVIPNAQITEAASGEEALNIIKDESFELICIDINLGDISGATLASTIRMLSPNVEIVFATAYNTYAENAFEVDSLYYLLKPFAENKVRQMFEKYNKKHYLKEMDDDQLNKKLTKIPLNVDKSIVLVDIASIIYIEAQNKNCIIHTKTRDYLENAPLKSFEEKLQDSGFFRIQKSFLVNIMYIEEIYPWFNNSYCVRMQGFEKDILPVSREKIKDLKNLLGI